MKFIEADATELPYGNNEYDLVLSFDVLHHIPNWDVVVEEINRILKPEGLYILSDLAYSGLTFKTLRNYLGKYMSLFTVDEFTNCLKNNNFDIIYEKISNYIFLRNISIVSKIELH